MPYLKTPSVNSEMGSPSIDVLIPTKEDFRGTLRVVQEAMQAGEGHMLRILVSVSDPMMWNDYERVMPKSNKIVLLPPPFEGLSLYQNFRRLIKESTAEWVSICADDDSIPSDFFEATKRNWTHNINLLVPPIELRSYDRMSQKFGNELISRFEPSDVLIDPILTSSVVWPTWVFGVWRGKWLRREFPVKDFDWLDCAVLHKALMSRGVLWVMDAQPKVCGYDPVRLSWSVSNEGYSTEGWRQYCLEFIQESPFLEKIRWWLLVERSLEKTARRLNTARRSSYRIKN